MPIWWLNHGESPMLRHTHLTEAMFRSLTSPSRHKLILLSTGGINLLENGNTALLQQHRKRVEEFLVKPGVLKLRSRFVTQKGPGSSHLGIQLCNVYVNMNRYQHKHTHTRTCSEQRFVNVYVDYIVYIVYIMYVMYIMHIVYIMYVLYIMYIMYFMYIMQKLCILCTLCILNMLSVLCILCKLCIFFIFYIMYILYNM